MSSLTERAVEAAAKGQWENRPGDNAPWDEIPEGSREFYRSSVRPTVLIAFGVVADHATTKADHCKQVYKTEPDDRLAVGVAGWASGLYELAAELRETP